MQPFKERIGSVLNTKVSRRQFLGIAASSFLVVAGISTMMQRLNDLPVSNTAKKKIETAGYGSSAYGR